MYRLCLIILLLPGWLFGQSADVYDTGQLTEIRITFAEPDWSTILLAYKEDPEEPRLTAQLSVNGVVYDSVGVRYKGNSSYNAVQRDGHRKLPFNIKIDHVLDDQELPGGYDKLKLSNGFRDPSLVREVMAYEIARQYMPASRANFARLYVNDEYLGVYTSVESVDKQFLKRRFGEKDGVLFKCDPVWGYERPAACPEGDKSSLEYLGDDPVCYYGLYELKSDTGWQALIDLAKMLHQEPDRLEAILDIDQTLWWLAFNNVVVNLDSYQGAFCHNYYLYQDRSGVFHPIIWDLNLAFGGFSLSGLKEQNRLSLAELQTMSMFIHYKQRNKKRPLITQLLANDLYRKIYVAHCKTILEDHFAEGQYLARAQALQEQIRDAVAEDTLKLYSDSAFTANLRHTTDADGTPIVGLLELMDKRAEYLLNHKLIQEPDPEVRAVDHQLVDSQVRISAEWKGAQRVWLFFRDQPGQSFRKMPMEFIQGEGPLDGGFERFEASVPYSRDMHYYLVGEGRINAATHPRRAGAEYLVVP